ncbi:MAG: c-type cytochrome domain-containing protein [Nannocystales bacterium]
MSTSPFIRVAPSLFRNDKSSVRSRLSRATLLGTMLLNACVLEAVDSQSSAGDKGEGAGGDDGTASPTPDAPDASDSGSGQDPSGGSDDGAPQPPGEDCAEVEEAAFAILEAHCEGCHNEVANAGGFGFVTDLERLLVSGRLVPGDASSSPLYTRVEAGLMPPPSVPEQPGPEEVAVLEEWVNSCVTPVQAECPAADWQQTEDIIASTLADVAAVDPVDRPFTRYLTLTHLYNAGYCDDEIDTFRFALSKAINSLSQNPVITPPLPIDEHQTVYRIDIRDYDWDAAVGPDRWDLLVDANPYAIQLLEDDALVLQDFTETDVPIMHADWFIHDATEPPLYYAMLGFPDTLQEIEADLGIDINENIATLEVARAGFLDSGVSQSNRIYERHQLPNAATAGFWISYDFATSSGQQNIFTNPLDFEPNGGEFIFNLPNGLQAYGITDEAGVLLDEAPVTIVTDPLQLDQTVRGGISCISCHDAGLKLKEDQIRDYVLSSFEFDVETKETIAELHVTNAEMADLIAEGSASFRAAEDASWAGARTNLEPTITAYSLFDANISLSQAAAELGITPDALLSQLGGLDPSFAPLASGTITREAFEDKFAETVCDLGLGLADDPLCDEE